MLKLWWKDFFTQVRDFVSIVCLLMLLILVGPFVFLFVCLMAPFSVFNNTYDIGDSSCLVKLSINSGLILLGVVLLPLSVLFGAFLIVKKLIRLEEINIFILFYDEL